MPNAPHLLPIREFPDRGVQWLLSRPANLRGLLAIVAPALAAAVDCSRTRTVNTTFIPDDLRKRAADVIHLVPYRDLMSGKMREIWIYILIEHQSDRDKEMGLRLLIYIVQLWETQRNEYLQKKIPVSQWRLHPIVPILFYTGQRRWTPDLSVASLMDLPPSLEEFTPRFKALYLPLKQTPPESLTTENHPLGWVLRTMRAEDAPLENMSAELQATVEWLEQLPKDEYVAWQEAMHFLGMLIHHRRDPDEHEHLRQVIEKSIVNRRHKQEVRKMAKTMAEFLIEKGKVEGRAEGEARGEVLGMIKAKQDDILRLMRLKFGDLPPEFIQRVQAIRNVERLDTLLEQVWNANSLKDIRWRAPRKS